MNTRSIDLLQKDTRGSSYVSDHLHHGKEMTRESTPVLTVLHLYVCSRALSAGGCRQRGRGGWGANVLNPVIVSCQVGNPDRGGGVKTRDVVVSHVYNKENKEKRETYVKINVFISN